MMQNFYFLVYLSSLISSSMYILIDAYSNDRVQKTACKNMHIIPYTYIQDVAKALVQPLPSEKRQ